MSAELLGRAVDACESLTQTVESKISDIDKKTDEAKNICSDAAGTLLNKAKTLGAWYVPETTITLFPAGRVGIEDPTYDYGTYESADSFNPTKLGQDNLLRIADFDSPQWTGGKASWTHDNRFVSSNSWAEQRVSLDEHSPCYVDLLDLNHFPRLAGRHNKRNANAIAKDKIPYLILRLTVEGQTHGVNRTFLEVLSNLNGSASNFLRKSADGIIDSYTPNSAVLGGGYVTNGYPIPVESAGYGGTQGRYNGLALIPLNTLHSVTQHLLLVNVGHQKMHIHSYGITYFDPQGLEVN